MRLTKILQGDYTLSRSYYQIKLPIDLEPMIPNNDPVRLLNACVEGMDLSELYQTYTRVPKNLATPKQLFKIVAYAAMNGIYSSRKIEAACRKNINYISHYCNLRDLLDLTLLILNFVRIDNIITMNFC